MDAMKTELPEHHIQREIFGRLVRSTSLRYSDLKPESIEANSFMYHLKELKKAGLVEQSADKAYSLSAIGKNLANSYSLVENRERKMPTIKSILLITNTQDDEILLYERLRHPGHGSIGLPSGNLHYGESPTQAAARELEEKTGYKGIEGKLTGTVSSIRQMDANTSHIVGLLSSYTVEEKNTHETKVGRTFWANPSSQPKMSERTKSILVEVATQKSSHFILELSD